MDPNAGPLHIQLSQKSLGLYSSSSKEVGVCFSPAFYDIGKKHRLTLKAFLSAPRKRQRGLTCSDYLYSQCAIRVVVYGMTSKKRDVAYSLSEKDLFLQHPTAAEYDAQVPYCNPHYLPGLGGYMPAIEGLDLSDEDGAGSAVCNLNEMNKARILQMFDAASGSSADVKVSLSTRIKSEMKE